MQEALKNSSFETYGSRTRDSLANWNPDCIGFNFIEAVLCHICRKERPGAVLVFMTGWDDISCLKDQLKAHPLLGDPNRVLLLACHGSMATSEQVIALIWHIIVMQMQLNLTPHVLFLNGYHIQQAHLVYQLFDVCYPEHPFCVSHLHLYLVHRG